MLQVLVADRQRGKTTQAMAWVSHGVRVKGYPGWSRVLVVHDIQTLLWMKGDGYDWWRRLEDFDHRVYSLVDWTQARGVNPSTEVCVDNLDLLLGRPMPRIPGSLVAFTITAEPWESLEFRARADEEG